MLLYGMHSWNSLFSEAVELSENRQMKTQHQSEIIAFEKRDFKIQEMGY